MKLSPETVVCAAPSLADANLHIQPDRVTPPPRMIPGAGGRCPFRSLATTRRVAPLAAGLRDFRKGAILAHRRAGAGSLDSHRRRWGSSSAFSGILQGWRGCNRNAAYITPPLPLPSSACGYHAASSPRHTAGRG